jgi:cation:H+ antiporter
MLIDIIFFIVGLVILILGADILVRGASGLAVSAGISKVVIGLTVVSLGTSAPEMAVSLQSGFQGQTDLLLGNVVGSNIANILLILGLSAIIAPLRVDAKLIRADVPIMIGLSLLMFVLVLDGSLARWESLLLSAILIGYVWFLFRENRAETNVEPLERPEPRWKLVAYLLAGLVGLVLGARWLVGSAVSFATLFGVSELVIGLTVVAVGTSLPELATSVIAAMKGERDIAVGNVIGSNIMNILAVLGVTGAIIPIDIPVGRQALVFDLPVMLAATIACFPIFFSRNRIRRWEGGILFAYFILYITYLVLDTTQNVALETFRQGMLFFVLPLTAITLATTLVREIRRRVRIVERMEE